MIKMKKKISDRFPFQSKYVEIFNTSIHYIDEYTVDKTGPVFLFLHGNPTSSYLWRNIIPYTAPLGRSIAIDLVGFGKSGKPDIDYTYQDHIKYVNGFIETLRLKNIVLVIHDWGGAIGFNYAINNPENIKGIVFMETFCRPMQWSRLDFLTRWIFKQFRKPKTGQKWNGRYNAFIRFIIPMSIVRKLSKTEMQIYQQPFATIASRKPIVIFPQELPFEEDNTINKKVVSAYYKWLQENDIPKLLLYAEPGLQIQTKEVELYKKVFKNLTATFIGKGKHYIQEDQPYKIGEAIKQWYLNLFLK